MEKKPLLTSYYSRHSDELRSKAKQYYEANRDKIIEKSKERSKRKYTCDACDKEILIANKSNHVRTFKHRDKVKALEKQSE